MPHLSVDKEDTNQLHVMVHIMDVARVYFYHVPPFYFILHAHMVVVPGKPSHHRNQFNICRGWNLS
jgi:hypothetical protein